MARASGAANNMQPLGGGGGVGSNGKDLTILLQIGKKRIFSKLRAFQTFTAFRSRNQLHKIADQPPRDK